MLDQLRQRRRPRQANGEVHMIRNAACARAFAVIIANDGSEIGMETCARFPVLKEGRAVLRTEDDVDEEVRERLRHILNFETGFQPSGCIRPYTWDETRRWR